MTDFKVIRALSTDLFVESGIINPRLIIEEGCWYLCTDTAGLFLGVSTEDGLTLKRINDRNPADVPTDVPTGGETTRIIIDAFIHEETGMLHLIYSDDTEDILGPVVGKDGLITAIKVNDIVYEHNNGIIELPDFITEHQDLSAYATTEFVANELSKIETPESEIYKVDFNAPNFTEAVEAYKAGKVLVLINAAPDVNSYAVMNYVSDKYITFAKFLTSRSETYGAFNTYYLSSENVWEVSKEVKLNKVEITDDGNLQVGKQVFEVPSIEGLATEEFVNQKIAEAELADKDIDLNAYYTKSEVDAKIPSLDGYAKVEDIPTDYLTDTDLEGYSKFSGSYNDLTDKPEIPSIDGFATEQFVKDEISKIVIPESTDLSNYYNKDEVDAKLLDVKVDDIPFKTAKFVAKAFGGFAVGDNLNGLTVAQLFAKLLELTDVKPGENPDVPDAPREDATPEEIVEYLVSKQATMYSQDEAGNLVETPFAFNTWTEEEAAAQMSGISTIYHIEDESGTIIESGYQEATDYNEEAWLTVALPSEIKKVKIKMYDPDLKDWSDVVFQVVPAEEQTMNGYTIWTVPEEYEIQSGDTYRFVIVE